MRKEWDDKYSEKETWTIFFHISSINPPCTSTVLISLNLALWSLLIYISLKKNVTPYMALMAQAGIKQKGEHTHTYHFGVFIWTANDGGWSVCVCVRDTGDGEGLVLNCRFWSISHISTLLICFSSCACFSQTPSGSYTDASLYGMSQRRSRAQG